MTRQTFAMALHGGAGVSRDRDYAREIAHMRGVVENGRDRLRAGASATDVVTESIVELEASGLYVAGRGASPNTEGNYELDASVMEGWTARGGAVAALTGYQSPIRAARAVMERTPHVLLAGDGANAFAAQQGLEPIVNPDAWFTRAGATDPGNTLGGLAHGTVGCVVLDGEGRLASGTSTGGVFGKRPGRVGDTPLLGAGTWADERVAVSGTGLGEYFIRLAVAAQVAFRMRFGGEALAAATLAPLQEVLALGGEGGLIAITRDGEIAMPFVSDGMKRAALTAAGEITSDAF